MIQVATPGITEVTLEVMPGTEAVKPLAVMLPLAAAVVVTETLV